MRAWRWLAVAAVFCAAAAVAYDAFQRQAAAKKRAERWARRQLDAAVWALLEQPITLDGKATKLTELVNLLTVQASMTVEIDYDALDHAGVDAARLVVWLPRGRLSCRAALQYAVADSRIAFLVEHCGVLITTSEKVEAALLTQVYPLPQPSLVTADSGEEEWAELISHVIAPRSWDDCGGPGHVEPVPGGLVVVQSHAVHEQVRTLLTRLGELPNPPDDWRPLWLAPYAAAAAAEMGILARLDQVVPATALEIPLDEWLAELSDRHGIPIVLARRALEEAGVRPDQPVAIRGHSVSLRSLLRSVLDELELTFVVRDEAIVVTTPEEAESQLVTVAYPVHDLVETHDGPEFDSLTDLIQSAVAPNSWDNSGGPGSLWGIAGGWLVFSQTLEVHEQVESLLAELRLRLSSERHELVMASDRPAAVAGQIATALEREIEIDYASVMIPAISADLSQQLGIPVMFQKKSLDEAGISLQTAVTCRFPRAAAREQVRRLCNDLGLAVAIRNEALLITTPEDVEQQPIVRIFDLRKFAESDLWPLDLLIPDHIDPNSWDQLGGSGAADCYQNLLVVSHTEEAHRQTAELLAAIEKHCLSNGESDGDLHQAVWASFDVGEAASYERLALPITLDICGATLDEAFQLLSLAAGVPVVLDRKAREILGCGTDWKITFAAENMTPAGMLSRLLPFKLTYTIRNRSLVVTTDSIDRHDCHARLYRVHDLASREGVSSDDLLHQLLDVVEPQAWRPAGDSASGSELGNGWWIVTADLSTHQRVDDWLVERRTGAPTQRAREREELESRRQGNKGPAAVWERPPGWQPPPDPFG